MGKRAEQQIVIDAVPRCCFDAIVDYETFPDWQGTVQSAEVLERDGEGRGKRVRFTLDLKVRTVGYTLDYHYEPPSHVTWDLVEGDVRSIQGEFVFEDLGDGRTLATYSLDIDPGLPLPVQVSRRLNDQVMRDSVEDLKRRVETLARA